ncbi:SprT-like domain-containing protein Spartan [Orchesella cincta]|uniref:SprT-like domain-containing protein Spartan n=1 Tax=Orchesella cincta TaxID=48709 RepID=A0A1D2MBW9_ORCCI|nr:SprT-like domain-containing protein Spartan [Orchesella cincta]
MAAAEAGYALALSVVDERWELIDPTPNIMDLFRLFDKEFFQGKLDGRVTVAWSQAHKMNSFVGYTEYFFYQNGHRTCTIQLSEPLLTLRPRKDLVSTLLHEMIHAYLWIVEHNPDRHEEHGPRFYEWMNWLNNLTGTEISVDHSFDKEVDYLRKQRRMAAGGDNLAHMSDWDSDSDSDDPSEMMGATGWSYPMPVGPTILVPHAGHHRVMDHGGDFQMNYWMDNVPIPMYSYGYPFPQL